MGILGLLIAGALAQTAPAPAPAPAGKTDETPLLMPSSNWMVDPIAGRCQLARGFGGVPPVAALVVERMPDGDDLIMLNVEPRGVSLGKARNVVVSNDLTGEEAKHGDANVFANAGKRLLVIEHTGPGFLNNVGPGAILTFRIGKRVVGRIKPVGMRKGIAALDQCGVGLLREWGVDLDARAKLRTMPVPSTPPYTWIKNEDFPMSEVQNGTRGVTTTRFIVGVDGAVHDCGIMVSSGSKVLDDTACRLLTAHGRYSPAIGEDGNPVGVALIQTIQWISWVGPGGS